MKKIFLISAMAVSLLAVAGPKADIEKATQLEKEGKQQEVIKLLKETKPVKGEEAEYEKIQWYLGSTATTLEDAIKYFKKAAENKNSKSEGAIQSNVELLNYAQTNEEKIQQLENLTNRLENKNVDYLAELALLYEITGNTSKANATSALGEKVDKEVFNFIMAQAHININKGAKVNYYATKALKTTSNQLKSSVYFALAQNELINTKDSKRTVEYIKSAEVLNPNNADLLYQISKLYTAMGDYKTSITYLKKVETIAPKEIVIKFELSMLYAVTGNVAESDKYAESIKKENKEIKNINLAVSFGNAGLLDQAEKYAQKAVKDKEKDASTILKQIKDAKAAIKK